MCLVGWSGGAVEFGYIELLGREWNDSVIVAMYLVGVNRLSVCKKRTTYVGSLCIELILDSRYTVQLAQAFQAIPVHNLQTALLQPTQQTP